MPPPSETPPTSVRIFSLPLRGAEQDDDIVERLAYQRCDDGDDSERNLGNCGDCGDAAKASCSRFAAFQERFLGPISPERAPVVWMVLNAFCLSWSLSLGFYLILCLFWYDNEIVASKATTTQYLVYSLTTTLVWVVEIALRAAFPPLETVLVVSTPTQSDDDDEEDIGGNFIDEPDPAMEQQQQVSRTFTAEESVVTLETMVQRRSKKHLTVLLFELLLAVFFGVETVLDCWNHWKQRHGKEEIESNDDDHYYMYEEDSETVGYSMLQQQSDIWINVLAYAYMTYHTYHEYYRAKTTSREIQRSVSSTLLSHQQYGMQQQQSPLRYPQQDFPRDASPTVRTTITRSIGPLSDSFMSPASNSSNTATGAGSRGQAQTANAAVSRSVMEEPMPQALSISVLTNTATTTRPSVEPAIERTRTPPTTSSAAAPPSACSIASEPTKQDEPPPAVVPKKTREQGDQQQVRIEEKQIRSSTSHPSPAAQQQQEEPPHTS